MARVFARNASGLLFHITGWGSHSQGSLSGVLRSSVACNVPAVSQDCNSASLSARSACAVGHQKGFSVSESAAQCVF